MAFQEFKDQSVIKDGGNGQAPDLDYIFHPRSIAFAGISSNSFGPGAMLMGSVIASGFQGDVYAVHPRGGEVMGRTCYATLMDIPGPVDHVVVIIPARYTPQFVDDCVAKGVKTVAFFTAGFSETGEEEGKRLEREIIQKARSGGVRLIGPNCMGIYCPSSGLSINPGMPTESGPLGFICQSGGNTLHGVSQGAARGVYFSKAVSYGNACDINEVDLLNYFAEDPDTKIITAYIEGSKQGQSFSTALRNAAQSKPVIVLKGGRTEAGAATAASHTGSLACSLRVWSALLRQSGVIEVNTLEEMIDATLPFLCENPPKGPHAGVIGIGGGASVIAADECIQGGLSVPRFPKERREMLKECNTDAGNIFNNPIDTQSFMIGVDEFYKTVRIVADWEGIDFLLLQVAFEEVMVETGMTSMFIQTMIDAAKASEKPTVVALHSATSAKGWQAIHEGKQKCMDAGIPIFYSVKSASNAVSRYLRYQAHRNNGAY